MALKHKGELEVELGLGLPRLTTAQRTAYTPPAKGYQVFDTDLNRSAMFDGTDWILGATLTELADKVNTNDGVVRNSLVLKNVDSDSSVLSLNAPSSVLGPPSILDERIGYNAASDYTLTLTENGTNVTIQGPVSLSSTAPALVKGSPITHVDSGKWYWETSHSTSASWSTVGILLLSDEAEMGSGYLGLKNHIDPTIGTEVTPPFTTGLSAGVYYVGTIYSHDDVTGGNVRSTDSARSWSSSSQTVRHFLDMDAGTYRIKIDNSAYFDIQSNITGMVAPSATIRIHTSAKNIKFRFDASEFSYDLTGTPEYSAFTENTAVGPSFPKITASAGVDQMELGLVNSTTLQFSPLQITSSTPVLGVDSTDVASFVTRASLQEATKLFTDTFVVADWTTTSGVSIIEYDAATHGLATGGDPYEIIVYELISGSYKSVSIDYSTEISSSKVTITTSGTPFDGQIKIS